MTVIYEMRVSTSAFEEDGGRTSFGVFIPVSSPILYLPPRMALRPHKVCDSDFKYVVPMCFGLGLDRNAGKAEPQQSSQVQNPTHGNGTCNEVNRIADSSCLDRGTPRGILRSETDHKEEEVEYVRLRLTRCTSASGSASVYIASG